MSVIPSWAKVGMIVICVEPRPIALPGLDESRYKVPASWPLVLNARYVIDGYGEDSISGFCTFELRGIKKSSWNVSGFDCRRFRPLVTKSAEDDIAMFLSLLRPADPIELATAALESAWGEWSMKLRVTKCDAPWNKGLWKIERHSWLWGWEDFDGTLFRCYDDAVNAALIAKALA